MNQGKKTYKEKVNSFLCFSGTGLLSTLIDQGLFALFANCIFVCVNMGSAIVMSTVVARICSSLFNYIMNKKVVFKSQNKVSSLIRYYTLCIVQMMASAAGVALAYAATKGNSSVLKVIVDLLLFFISYQIQKQWVFKDK